MRVEDCEKVYAIADEDLERDNAEKTSAVHFMRFELNKEMIDAVKSGSTISAGVEHANYQQTISPVASNLRDSLAGDLS